VHREARAPGPARQQRRPAAAADGSQPYLSPEQARGERVGPAADVWGLGVVLFEAASAERPFRARGTASGYGQLDGRADPILRRRRLPAQLAEVIDGCLEPQPPDRPGVADVTRALNALV
jgi:eukaryotic-like serine/threonine-protein kinase